MNRSNRKQKEKKEETKKRKIKKTKTYLFVLEGKMDIVSFCTTSLSNSGEGNVSNSSAVGFEHSSFAAF